MRHRALCTLALSAVMALGGSGAALAAKAPEDPVERHFQDLEKQIKQLRTIVTQARDSGQPVQVRMVSDPDPVVQGLQQRLDDMEQAAQTRNAQIDSLTHDLDQARKDAADARDQVKALEDRLSKLETAVKAQSQAAAQQAVPAGDAAAPGEAGGAAPVAAAGDPDSAFKNARQLLLEGQYAAAGGAFQDFVQTYGDTDHGPEARYWLGETLFIRGMYPDAAAAYIGAIRGWPQTGWAPDAVLKLARSLIAMDKGADACRTLDELEKRYPDAPTTVKTRADAARSQAACGAGEAKAAAKTPAKASAKSSAKAKTASRASRRR